MLGSLNLSEFVIDPFTDDAEFNFIELNSAVEDAVIALNEVLDEGLPLHPLEEQTEIAEKWRQIGLGVMGIGDMLIKLGMRYGSNRAINKCEAISTTILNIALQTSAKLAEEEGTYPAYKEDVLDSDFFQFNTWTRTEEMVRKHGLRNSQLLTIAPTGSTSNLLGVTGGIEPIYDLSYNRKTESLDGEDKSYKVYTPIVKKYMEDNGIESEDGLPPIFVTAHDLHYEERLDMQSVFQESIDASISSTINLSKDATVEDIIDIYIKGWEKGLKGVTVFRDGCHREGILSKDDEVEAEREISCNGRGEVIDAQKVASAIRYKMKTGCGTLYLNIVFDDDGRIVETFTESANGGCAIFTKATSRLISLALRGGIPIEEVIDQLSSAGICPAYQSRKIAKKDVSPGYSCANAIARKLKEVVNTDAKIDVLHDTSTQILDEKEECPRCGRQLQFSMGCKSCTCGYSHCG